MSTIITAAVWAASRHRPAHKLVLLALADGADQHGNVSMSRQAIAGPCNLSPSRVREILDDLTADRSLRVVQVGGAGPGNAAKYRLTVAASTSNRAVSAETETDSVESRAPEAPVNVTENDFDPSHGTAILPAEPLQPAGLKAPQTVSAETGVEYDRLRGRGGTGPCPGIAAPTSLSVPVVTVKASLSAQDVETILGAAGVEPPADQPLYWFRREFVTELAAILADREEPLDKLADALRSARADGCKPAEPVRRLADVLPMIGG